MSGDLASARREAEALIAALAGQYQPPVVRDLANVVADLLAALPDEGEARCALRTIWERLRTSHHITVRIDGRDEDGGWIKEMARRGLGEWTPGEIPLLRTPTPGQDLTQSLFPGSVPAPQPAPTPEESRAALLALADAAPEPGTSFLAGAAPVAPQPAPTTEGVREAFVAGAAWHEFYENGATIWTSDRRIAEAEAERRFPTCEWIESPRLTAAEERTRELESLLRECNAVCLCGCPDGEHEADECGESCGLDDHECIRVPKAVLAYVDRLRSHPMPPSVEAAAEKVRRLRWESGLGGNDVLMAATDALLDTIDAARTAGTDDALSVYCGVCESDRRVPCHSTVTGEVALYPHPERVVAARGAKGGAE